MRDLVEQLHRESDDTPDVGLLVLEGELAVSEVAVQHGREYPLQR